MKILFEDLDFEIIQSGRIYRFLNAGIPTFMIF